MSFENKEEENEEFSKTKSQKANDLKQILNEDNNCIDYFLEIGIKPETFREEFLYVSNSISDISKKLKPEIISKFPWFDKKLIVIDSTITNYLFPQGFKATESKEKPKPEFFSLILDNQLYSAVYLRKYLTCLKVYESINDYRNIYNNYYNKKDNNENKNYSNYYIPKCLCIVSIYPYVKTYEEILETIYNLISSNKYPYIFIEQLIEELVIKIPKIPRGLKKIEICFPDSEIMIKENKMNEYPLISSNLEDIFKFFNTNNILEIFKNYLFETNIVFFSSKLKELTNIIMSFLFLIYPFKYQFKVISSLPKEKYYYLQEQGPFIFGINETFSQKFFDSNKIELDETIFIVDIDNNSCKLVTSYGNVNVKEYPNYPKLLKTKIEAKINEYFQEMKNSETNKKEKEIKNSKIKKINDVQKIKNEKIQKIFRNFMIEFLEDYPKYINKDYSGGKNVDTMIDLNNYIHSLNVNDRDFYAKIFSTQSFIDFIYRRVTPKNYAEKIESVFFEEKIIEFKKKVIKTKIIEQNILTNSKKYDFSDEPLIVSLSKTELFPETLNLLMEKDNIKEKFLTKGYIIEKDTTNVKYIFKCAVFPSFFGESLFNEKLISNSNLSSNNFCKEIDKINSEVYKGSFVKFYQKKFKKFELENDLYICYLILWGLSLWYMEKNERDYRFNKMIKIFDKVERHESDVLEIMFKNIIKYGSEESICLLYLRFLYLKLKPLMKIYSTISDVIKKKSISNKLYKLLNKENKSKLFFGVTVSDTNNDNLGFLSTLRSRTVKTPEIDDNFFSDEVRFNAYNKCSNCNKIIELGKLCSDLSLMKFEKINTLDVIKCPNKTRDGKLCGKLSENKLKLTFGIQLFNQKLTLDSTSTKNMVLIQSPTTIKLKLLEIIKRLNKEKENFDVELFKYNFPNEFWNLIWYFRLNKIDPSFFMPYSKINPLDGEIDEGEREKVVGESNIKVKNVCFKKENKNSNTPIEIFRQKIKKKFEENELYEQIVYQFCIIKKIGMMSYKGIGQYEENIGFNELPLMFKKIVNQIDPTRPSGKRFTLISQNSYYSGHSLNYSYSNSNILNESSYSENNERKSILSNSYSTPELNNFRIHKCLTASDSSDFKEKEINGDLSSREIVLEETENHSEIPEENSENM